MTNSISPCACRMLDAFPPEWTADPCVLDHGAVLCLDTGTAHLRINFRRHRLQPGSVAVLFPHDIISLETDSSPCRLQMLTYPPHVLREASLQMETAIYESLHADGSTSLPEVSHITRCMLTLLRAYATQQPTLLDRQATLQLKAYFLGFYGMLTAGRRHLPGWSGADGGRANRLFNTFMTLLENHHRQHHDVGHYATALAITPKHLSSICRNITGRSAKSLIHSYLITHIKLALHHTHHSVKELSYQFGFPTSSHFCQFFKQHTHLTPLHYRTEGWKH